MGPGVERLSLRLADTLGNRQTDLSVPDSPSEPPPWHAGRVLGSMRGPDGRPTGFVRVVGVVVALLLALPLTALAAQGLEKLVDAVL